MAAKFKRFLLSEVAFIGGTLLAPGSIVTSDDLGTFKDPKDGKEKPVRAPASAIEVDESGRPVSSDDADAYASLVGSMPAPAAEIAPFAPGGGQAMPSQQPGGVQLAGQQVNQPSPVAPTRRGGNSDVNKAAEAAASAQLDKASGDGSEGDKS